MSNESGRPCVHAPSCANFQTLTPDWGDSCPPLPLTVNNKVPWVPYSAVCTSLPCPVLTLITPCVLSLSRSRGPACAAPAGALVHYGQGARQGPRNCLLSRSAAARLAWTPCQLAVLSFSSILLAASNRHCCCFRCLYPLILCRRQRTRASGWRRRSAARPSPSSSASSRVALIDPSQAAACSVAIVTRVSPALHCRRSARGHAGRCAANDLGQGLTSNIYQTAMRCDEHAKWLPRPKDNRDRLSTEMNENDKTN